MEYSRPKANCMALHQPFGVWQKILWKLPEHSRRSTACSNRQKYSKRQEELASCLQETIENYWCDDAATSPLAVQNKLDRLNREFDRLLLLNGDEENVFLEKKLQKINNEILSLKQEVKYTERQNVQNRDKMDKLREVMELLSAENMEITEYSDVLVCRLIEQITVLSKTEIRIRFVGGYEVEQKLLI